MGGWRAIWRERGENKHGGKFCERREGGEIKRKMEWREGRKQLLWRKGRKEGRKEGRTNQ